MKNISTAQKILVFLGVLNLIFLGVYFFVFSLIKDLNEQSSALALEINFFKERESVLVDLENMLEEVSVQAEQLDSFFVPADGVVYFFEEIENVAMQSGVNSNVTSVTNIDLEGYDGVDIMALKIDTFGRWDGVFRFISFLEYLPYQSNLTRINLSKIQNEPIHDSLDQEQEEAFYLGGLWRANLDWEVLRIR